MWNNVVLQISRDGAVAARLAHNQEVVGSSPTPATKIRISLERMGFLFWKIPLFY